MAEQPSDTTRCDEVRADLGLLALDALDPAERDELHAHVDGCPGCRAALDDEQDLVASVLVVAPSAELPSGFADRALAARRVVPIRRSPRRAALLVAASIVVVLLIAAASLVLLGRGGGDDDVVSPDVRVTGQLISSGGASTGSVSITAGDHPTLEVALDRSVSGTVYECSVRTSSGALVPVGSWTSSSPGIPSWSVPLDPQLVDPTEVVISGPGGVVYATASLR